MSALTSTARTIVIHTMTYFAGGASIALILEAALYERRVVDVLELPLEEIHLFGGNMRSAPDREHAWGVRRPRHGIPDLSWVSTRISHGTVCNSRKEYGVCTSDQRES